MVNTVSEFTPQKRFLVCVDSDGCAMDTMDIKHIRCFGPCMVEEWQLGQWREEILARWNDLNLYTMTRGINRFKGLVMALAEISETYTPIDGIADLVDWAEHAKELSNRAVAEEYDRTGKEVFRKALRWSEATNASIDALPESDKRPFDGVVEGLAAMQEFADVAVVSSANRDAVTEEWQRCGLLEHVDVLLCQDAGSKAHCIGELLKKGYDPHNVLMVGDAPGDKAAAEQNGVYYYPILVRHEADSWRELRSAGLSHFRGQTYAIYGEQKIAEFLDNLKGE